MKQAGYQIKVALGPVDIKAIDVKLHFSACCLLPSGFAPPKVISNPHQASGKHLQRSALVEVLSRVDRHAGNSIKSSSRHRTIRDQNGALEANANDQPARAKNSTQGKSVGPRAWLHRFVRP
jgi:hypothetical protein